MEIKMSVSMGWLHKYLDDSVNDSMSSVWESGPGHDAALSRKYNRFQTWPSNDEPVLLVSCGCFVGYTLIYPWVELRLDFASHFPPKCSVEQAFRMWVGYCSWTSTFSSMMNIQHGHVFLYFIGHPHLFDMWPVLFTVNHARPWQIQQTGCPYGGCSLQISQV